MRKGRREKKKGNDYLVTFFKEPPEWMWMARNNLEPLGAEDEIDQNKIKSIKKPKERKLAREAYERAIVQRLEGSAGTNYDNLISEDEDDKEDEEAGDEEEEDNKDDDDEDEKEESSNEDVDEEKEESDDDSSDDDSSSSSSSASSDG